MSLDPIHAFEGGAVGLIVARVVASLGLDRLNLRHVRQHADAVPEGLRETMDDATYTRSVNYTLAKGRLGMVETVYEDAVLVILLLSGVLPWAWSQATGRLGSGVWAGAAYLFAVGVFLTMCSLPLAWHLQFHLETRFGFNTTTRRLWILDRLKGLLLGAVLAYPLLVLVLWLFTRAGARWWLWAWAVVLGFQLVVSIVAPVLILPLFNKFTPLPAGELRDRLLALAERTRFRARSIQVMDGSRRSRHSNAFFTGFGRFRKIVLFDTLVEQLSGTELEAVLAHEIGHYRRRHILKLLLASAAGLLLAFYVLGWLARQGWFTAAFGFAPGDPVGVLLLFGLLSGTVTFWLSPLANLWSRRFEYEADAFAAQALNDPHPLIRALRQLSRENLSNLTPHPLYSGFHYSHPTLLEREQALMRDCPPAGQC